MEKNIVPWHKLWAKVDHALLIPVVFLFLCCRDSDRSLDIFDEKSHPLTVNQIVFIFMVSFDFLNIFIFISEMLILFHL